ncbi:cytochrome P450 [Polyplosphaeria fusca]|uniref:Cytochrome P450 n=1 Tax=Polyplosphaeria fusca TaxID=682080 RepID=A0A9P4QPN3_9PLEO|nr:cytochrome P450 [Polyplosphaeria fusca]
MPALTRFRCARIPYLHIFAVSVTFATLPIPKIHVLIYAIVNIFLYTEELLWLFQDPAEPALIPHPYLPFVGHVIGMFWYGASYFERVHSQCGYPIFTLQTMNKRTIVVISPQLAEKIQKKSKDLSFYGMILEVTKRLVDFDEASMATIRYNIDGERGTDEGLMNESHAMVASVLSPGPVLNSLSTTQLFKFSELLDEACPDGKPLSISLMDFVKNAFTTANAHTIYGPKNPFALYPDLVRAFWIYEAGMISVMADILPWLTARRPWLARRAINNALQEFIEKEYYRAASPLIQKRVAINLKHGLTTKMAGRAELILLFGIIGNAVPTTFWILANVFARPDLLRRLREEMATAVLCAYNPATGKKQNSISVEALKTRCPLLVSTYKESLRMIGNLASVRLVTGTHTITAPGHAPVLLKKGSMIQIASGVIHVSEAVWGADAKEFKPERFISSATTSEHAAYRAFGGGSVICPGRHFAQSEILGFVALCFNMFDVVDRETDNVIAVPERDNGRIPLSVMKPVKEPHVIIKRRSGEEDVLWQLELQ